MSTEAISTISPALPRRLSAELHNEVAIVVVTSLGHALCHIGELVFLGALFAGIGPEFNLQPAQATALGLLGFVLMGVGAVPVGMWADALGPTRVFRVYFYAMALAALLVPLAGDVWTLFAALTLLGLATSIYHPVGLALISLGVRAKGRAMGINGVCGSIGVAIGPALGLGLAELGMWRAAYVVVAVLALLGALMLEIALRYQKTDGESYTVTPVAVPVAAGPRVPLPMLLLMGTMMLGGLNYRMLMTALPTFLAGLEPGRSGAAIVALTLVVGGVGQYVGGWRADRSARRVYLILLLGLALATATLANVEGRFAILAAASLVAFFLFGQQPVENTLLAEIASRGRRSLSYGVKFALTFGVGALGSQVVGYILKWYGTPVPTFYVISMSALAMAVLAFWFARVAPRAD